MNYRLHIDIPLGQDEEEAVKIAQTILQHTFNENNNTSAKWRTVGVGEVNYRLGYDEDRQKSNYLDKNENGHVSNKKNKISY